MMSLHRKFMAFFVVIVGFGVPALVYGDAGHPPADEKKRAGDGLMEELRELHRGHKHGHDFEAMEHMSPEQAARMIKLMQDIGIALPPMNSARGRKLFAEKGCVICHSVNGIGVEIGPSLNAADMPSPMNAFEFAARMWRGAPAMAAMQESELGGIINLTGQELADLIAFAHDAEEQKKLTEDQIPKRFRDKMAQ